LIDLNKFENIFIKCPNITSIALPQDIQNIDSVFALIIKYCNRLTQIESNFKGLSEDMVKEFYQKFGSNLKTIIRFDGNNRRNKTILSLCPSVTYLDIYFNSLSIVFNLDQLLVNRLEKIIFNYNSEDMKRFEVLIEKNKMSLKSINISIYSQLTEEELKPLFKGLTQL